jgi:hypothetical protein
VIKGSIFPKKIKNEEKVGGVGWQTLSKIQLISSFRLMHRRFLTRRNFDHGTHRYLLQIQIPKLQLDSDMFGLK